MPLSTNLVSYWKLDESSGNASDSVSSNTLTNNNTVTYSAGKINNGANFNGSTQWLDNTSPSGLPSAAGARSVSFWFNSNSFGSGVTFFSYGNTSTANTYFEVNCSSSTAISVDINSAVAAFTVPTMSTGVWYHVVVTYPGSGSTWTLYLNGISYTASGATPNTSVTKMGIGKNIVNNVQYFNGSIDEVGVWSRALSSDEVLQLHNSGRGNAYPLTDSPTLYGAVTYWKLDESSGNATDIIGSVVLTNNGTLTYTSALINNGASTGTSNSTKYFSVANAFGINGGACSISMWVKLTTEITSGTYGFFQLGAAGTGTEYIISYEYNGGSPRLAFNRQKQNVSNNYVNHTTTLGTSSFHHLVLTYDGTTLNGYFDGSVIGTPLATSGTGSGVSDNVEVFRTNGQIVGSYASAIGDEMGVWAKSLSSGEVSTLYNAGVGKAYPWASTGYPITAGVGAFTLTGVNNNLLFGRNIVASAGSFALTGISVALNIGKVILAEVGSFVLTGIDVALRFSGWTKRTKNTTTWTDQTKNTTTWTNVNKH